MSSLKREFVYSSAESPENWTSECIMSHVLYYYDSLWLWGYHGQDVVQVHITREGLPQKSVRCLSKKIPCRVTVADRQLPKVNTSIELEVIAHYVAWRARKSNFSGLRITERNVMNHVTIVIWIDHHNAHFYEKLFAILSLCPLVFWTHQISYNVLFTIQCHKIIWEVSW